MGSIAVESVVESVTKRFFQERAEECTYREYEREV